MAWIYIVEDDSSIREIERFALQNSGYQVREFACGKDFYTEVSQRTPDCVLLDILLPDEDGLEILTKFRAMPGMRRIPVMMVTAKTKAATRPKVTKARRARKRMIPPPSLPRRCRDNTGR